ncbi:MAG: hypothetical protein FWH27_07330, partial [Planctomycetaceae bacterium]|nr:hypothetical protein [Planctomycetaceae bacterium]
MSFQRKLLHLLLLGITPGVIFFFAISDCYAQEKVMASQSNSSSQNGNPANGNNGNDKPVGNSGGGNPANGNNGNDKPGGNSGGNTADG